MSPVVLGEIWSTDMDAPRGDMDTSAPPAYGSLIEETRKGKSPRLPQSQAAAQAGISKATWIDYVRGYRRRGSAIEVINPDPGVIARMAAAVGVTPAELDETGQDEASRILRRVLRGAAAADAPEPGRAGLAGSGPGNLRLAGPSSPFGAGQLLPDAMDDSLVRRLAARIAETEGAEGLARRLAQVIVELQGAEALVGLLVAGDRVLEGVMRIGDGDSRPVDWEDRRAMLNGYLRRNEPEDGRTRGRGVS